MEQELSPQQLLREVFGFSDFRPGQEAVIGTRLELLEVIRAEGPYYAEIRFVAKVSSSEIFQSYPEKQAAFLRKLFTCCKKSVRWITLDMLGYAAIHCSDDLHSSHSDRCWIS